MKASYLPFGRWIQLDGLGFGGHCQNISNVHSIMTFAILSNMVEHLEFSFVFKVFGVLYCIATAITSTFFVLVLRRSILQFPGSTTIGNVHIIWKREPRKPPNKIRFIPPNNPRSLCFGAESIRDHHFMICRDRDSSKSNIENPRFGKESTIANQNN